ncbi:hypothetical protein GSI_15409 [Ganoderma sinense ZZ0214-1]|uniref:F-box domain-containing protein n=1 Tax=Ganoderma sinense ZZ0214-1 TaxID=1077348 RepID=A0A2G8RMI3_9APHY|nr:hypothetical protein GSI_15409 [Ganoderma sinense ZZ0214-1]
MADIDQLPIEVLEQIILFLDPIDVAKFSQTHSAYYNLIHHAEDEHLWRELYLQQPFDDPRKCYTPLGRTFDVIHWKSQLQRIIRARTVLTNLSACHPDERGTVLQTLVDMVCTVIPITHPDDNEISMNHVWVTAMLRASSLLEHDGWELSPEEHQLRAQLHTYFGLTPADFQPSKRTESRAFVYAMRHYKYDNDFGPFFMDGSGRVNWHHVQTIHHIMSMHIVPTTEETQSAEYNLFPMSMPWTQSILPDGNLDKERDWAGVTGRWRCSFCFCDHRELLIYNGFNVSDTTPLDTEIFDHPDFVEVYRSIYVELSVLGTEEDPDHPGRPRINFGGSIDGNAVIVGYVKVTPDDQIHWHFTSGEQGNSIWSSEGIQVGNVRSRFGVLGSWTTVAHDRHDPVGPFWLCKTEESAEGI